MNARCGDLFAVCLPAKRDIREFTVLVKCNSNRF
jgi:hypothetical protein